MPSSGGIRPPDMILRCYLRRTGRDERWVAHCVDLDLWAVGKSAHDARYSLEQAIDGYVETVLDTEDKGSVLPLLRRRAPLRFVLLWHLIRLVSRFRHNGKPPLDSEPFEEPMPLRFAPAT